MGKILIFLLLYACKQPTASVKTMSSAYQALSAGYSGYVLLSGTLHFFDETIKYEQILSAALSDSKNNFTAAEREHLLKIQRHVQSIIAYAVHSRCFKLPAMATIPFDMRLHHLERDWADRYDYNYYSRGQDDYTYQLSIDDTRLCYVFLAKLKELALASSAPTSAHADFFQRVMADKVKSLNSEEMRAAIQRFFKESLAPQILRVTEESMARADFLFPFHRQDYVQACEAYRDHYDLVAGGADLLQAGSRVYRYPDAIRKQIDCSPLRKLPTVAAKTRRKVNCADKYDFTWENITETPYTSLETLSAAVNKVIVGMNTYRAELDKLVKTRLPDKFKARAITDKYGEEYRIPQYYSPYTEKKPWILPFLKIKNETKLKLPPIVEALDAYHCHLIEATKDGIFPVIFASTMQRATGSVYLSHSGRFFGFGQVEYKQLKAPSPQNVGKALAEVKDELIAHWVALQAARIATKPLAERKIYETILGHELAVAQLLLHNPEHIVVVDHLLRDFQNEPVTPKWLRVFKDVSLAGDLAFVVISVLGGFVTGGIGTIPILVIANSINFLWIGAATAEHVVARNRYRLVERALLTGNSEQVERGMKILRAFHAKRRDLIGSGAIGLPLTLTNLSLIAKGMITGTGAMAVDISAAVLSDIEMLSMPDEKSDVQIHQEK